MVPWLCHIETASRLHESGGLTRNGKELMFHEYQQLLLSNPDQHGKKRKLKADGETRHTVALWGMRRWTNERKREEQLLRSCWMGQLGLSDAVYLRAHWLQQCCTLRLNWLSDMDVSNCKIPHSTSHTVLHEPSRMIMIMNHHLHGPSLSALHPLFHGSVLELEWSKCLVFQSGWRRN